MPEPRPRVPPSDRDALHRGEAWAFGALFAALLALRVLHVFRQVFDTDEPQHLHDAWAWIRGLVPYRDVFDDHAPLFHLLSTPLVALVGERAEILFVARLAMLPLFAGILWLVQDVGRRAVGRRTGLWAAAFFAFYPEPFIVSLEFRTDVLWTLFWLLALRALLAGPPDPKRLFRAGLWFGAAVGTSQKSALLAVALTVAALALLATSRDARGALRSCRPVACLAAWTGGALVVPLALVLLFAALGAIDDLAYGVVGYGRAAVRLLPSRPASGVAAAVAGFAAAVGAAAWIARRPWALATRIRTSVLVLVAAAYVAILLGYWPLDARQTWLPSSRSSP